MAKQMCDISNSDYLCRRARIEEINLSCIILALGKKKDSKEGVCILGEKTLHKTAANTPNQLWDEYSRMVLNIIEYSTVKLVTKESFLSILGFYPFNNISWTESRDVTFPSPKSMAIEDLEKIYV